jgi:hypothetical protein
MQQLPAAAQPNVALSQGFKHWMIFNILQEENERRAMRLAGIA